MTVREVWQTHGTKLVAFLSVLYVFFVGCNLYLGNYLWASIDAGLALACVGLIFDRMRRVP